MEDFENLIKTNILGFYNSCEAIQIYLTKKENDGEENINVYTIFTFEEKEHIKKDRIHITPKLKEIDDFSLGINRHYFSLEESKEIFNKLINKNYEEETIVLKGKSLKLLSKQYIPPNKDNRLNKILKNNFLYGSYIFEFFEENKNDLNRYYKYNPKGYEKILEIVKNLIPIDLSLNPERFGNYIFQLPITLLQHRTYPNNDYTGINIDFIWNQKIEDKPNCIITTNTKIEDNILNSNFVEYNGRETQFIETGPLDKTCEITLWRKKPNLILFNEKGIFSRNVTVSLKQKVGERVFFNHKGMQKVSIKNNDHSRQKYADYIYEIYNTITRNNENQLEKELSFKLLKGKNDEYPNDDPLEYLIQLIQKHCHNGVWIVDPYLSAGDLLSTVYYSNIENVPIKAITSEKMLGNYKDISDKNEVIAINRQYLCLTDKTKLNLEFKIEYGENSFHDRFLIFPGNSKKLEKAKAYSLGTSVNGFGKSCHVLQEISTPHKIAELFDELWNKLDKRENLIWKS